MTYSLLEYIGSSMINFVFRISALILLTPCLIKEYSASDLVHNCENTCFSNECIDYAADAWNKIDITLDPCDNFYNFVCSKYPENTFLVNTKRNLIPFTISTLPMFNRLQDIILGKYVGITGSMVEKRKIIYESCMKSDSRKHEIKSLMSSISSIITNWPDPTQNYKDTDLTTWISKLILLNEFSFVSLDIVHRNWEELGEFSERFADLPPTVENGTSLTFSPQRSFLIKNCVDCETDSFRQYLTDVLESAEISSHLIEQILNDAFRIDEFLRTTFSHVSDMEEAGLECEAHNDNRCCEILTLIIEETGALLNISSLEMFVNYPRVVESINFFLRNESKTSIANYLAIRFLNDNIKIVDFFTERNETVFDTISASHVHDLEMLDRRQKCTFFMAEHFPYALMEDYLRSVDGVKKLEVMLNIFDRIKEEAYFRINSTLWSEELKHYFLRIIKLTCLYTADHIKYVTQKLDLENRFRNLHAYADSVASNLLEAKRMKQFDRIVNHLHGFYFMELTYSNMFYAGANVKNENEINFGLTILEKPNVGVHRPKYADLAVFGGILSHELGHIITPGQSTMQTNDSDAAILSKFYDCLKDTYSSFKIPMLDTTVDGEQTYAENIADVIGVTLAYSAFKTYISEKGGENLLPGLDFTNEEMFFISYAQHSCEFGYKKEYDYYREDDHTPFEHRVNGPLMNFHSFAEVFKCPLGSPMNPSRKCNFWQ